MSLKICSLASGSKGNCCFVSDGITNILIDLGISASRAVKCLNVLGVDPRSVTVLVTHSHSDHVGGLKVFCKAYPEVRVLCQKECARGVETAGGVRAVVCEERKFGVGTLQVTALPVSHDVPCFGYIVSDGGKKAAVVTDVGVLNTAQLTALSGCDMIMLECNHDIERLAANPRYSQSLKNRIISRHGHLSNADCAAACAFLASNGVHNFILAHLSEDNNEPSLALNAVEHALEDAGLVGVRVVAATQNAMSGLFEIC